MLISNGEGDRDCVDLEMFVGGCMRLKGIAISLDVNSLFFETKVMHSMQRGFIRYSGDRFRSIDERLAILTEQLASTQRSIDENVAKLQEHAASSTSSSRAQL